MSRSVTTNNPIRTLVKTVIEGGYCIGCGACAALEGSPFEIVMNDLGQYEARISERFNIDATLPYEVASVCPFADGNPDEDAIARKYGLDKGRYTDGIGYSVATFAGYVLEDDFRERGSSGGLVTWLLCTLLAEKLVDAVVHVRETPFDEATSGKAPLFTMQVSRSINEVRAGAKSRYYPVEMSRVLEEIRKSPGRYALVGVPCFVKAVRLLALQDPIIRRRIVYCISLVCGHLKSDRFARMLAWEAGIRPNELRTIDFRRKLLDRPANRYAVEFTTIDGRRKVVPIDNLPSYNWGYGFFKYQGCDYCDDVVGETADISIGDAWLPAYVSDPRGTNVVVVRNEAILELLTKADQDHRLHLEPISPADVVASQDAGIRHRRQGLAYRLHLRERNGEWVPKKRVRPSEHHLATREKQIQDLRIKLRIASHKAFAAALEQGSLTIFSRAMMPLVRRYRQLYGASLFTRGLRRIQRFLGSVINYGRVKHY